MQMAWATDPQVFGCLGFAAQASVSDNAAASSVLPFLLFVLASWMLLDNYVNKDVDMEHHTSILLGPSALVVGLLALWQFLGLTCFRV